MVRTERLRRGYDAPMQLTVVLVRSRYAGNLGSAVRVAANLGVARLVLVNPSCSMEDIEYMRMSTGCEDVVDVRTVDSLAEAVSEADAVVATTSSRNRDPRGLETPSEVRMRLAGSGAERVALVFGPERSGLSHEELRACTMLLTVPTNPAAPVLNLAQAVGIVTAALAPDSFQVPRPRGEMDGPASAGELDAALGQLRGVLLDTGFLDPANPDRVMDQLRRWVGRSVPTRRELAILRALAAHMAYVSGHSPREG